MTMKRKNYYMALQCEMDGFKWASCLTVVSGHTNVACILKEEWVMNALMCDTKAHCLELVEFWNKQYKEQGVQRYA